MNRYGYPEPAYRLHILVLILIFYSLAKVTAQPAIPRFKPFKHISPLQAPPLESIYPLVPRQVNPLLPNDPYREQNLRLIQQGGMDIPDQPAKSRQQQERTVQEAREERKFAFQSFQSSLQEFRRLNPEHFSITKAVYLAESTYDPALLPFKQFEAGINILLSQKDIHATQN